MIKGFTTADGVTHLVPKSTPVMSPRPEGRGDITLGLQPSCAVHH